VFRMNCNDFETKITDLARGQMMTAEARDRAIAHAAGCRRCAARLRDEQRLTAGLREWSATFSDEKMPARGEAQLLAALRAERSRAPVTKRARRWPAWAAAAAVLIVLIALAAMRFVEWRKPQTVADNSPRHQPVSSPAPARPENQPAAPSPEAQPPANRLSVPLPEQAVIPPHRTRHAPRSVPQKVVRKPAGDASLATTQAGDANGAAVNGDEPASEIATAFIPLDTGRGLAPADSLQLVRVELPRAALVSFGLPMNVERADQRIKADILVGNDGVARAIRFVR
jgi:anti-sigma factor RsiW